MAEISSKDLTAAAEANHPQSLEPRNTKRSLPEQLSQNRTSTLQQEPNPDASSNISQVFQNMCSNLELQFEDDKSTDRSKYKT